MVSGRRGHYDFCDELRAFDLGTGSMYRVASCSGLALTPGGGVNHRATDAARKLDRERGTVSLDEIREAAWMMLQLGELDERVLTLGFGQALPPGISPESDGAETIEGLGSLSVNMSSAEKVTPSCPPASPPAALITQLANLLANHLDTDANSLDKAAISMRSAWRDLVGDGCSRD